MKKPLFFDIEKLERYTECNPEYLVLALEYLSKRKYYPKNKLTKYKPLTDLVGNAYLLNLEGLLLDKSDILWKAQYIRLAGRRSYSDFTNYGNKYLDLGLYPDIDTNSIKHNPLLKIVGTKIYFKYEE